MSLSIFYILPEILLALGVIVIMFSGLFLYKKNKKINYIIFQIFIIITLLSTFIKSFLIQTNNIVSKDLTLFSDLISILQLIILIISIFIALYSRKYIEDRKISDGDFYTLFILSIFGAIVLTAAHNLITIYVGLELLSLPMYGLIAIHRSSAKSLDLEAAIKYFVLGAITSALLLFGMSFLYGITGKLEILEIANVLSKSNDFLSLLNHQFLLICLLMIIVTFLFKLGAFPFHMWLPDVYQGAPIAVTTIVSTIPKVAAFATLIKFLFIVFPSLKDYWVYLFKIIGILSIIFGSLVALSQTNIKRFLAYSGVSQLGFILLSITLSSQHYALTTASFYIIIYIFTTLAIFGLLTTISIGGHEVKNINDLKGLNTKNSLLALIFLIVLFSMSGIPPFGGFIAKFSVVMGLINDSSYFLACFLLFMTVISSFYYIRIIKTIYFDNSNNKIINNENNITNLKKPSLISSIALIINMLIILSLGIMPTFLLSILTKTTY